MKRADVKLHSDRGPARPAINVKVYSFGRDSAEIAERFKCSATVAERAAGWAWNSAVRLFWERAGEAAREVFGPAVKVYSEGRSGGWLVVDGLPDLEAWTAPDLGKWARFEKILRAEIEDLCSREHVLEDIEANRWAEENAEEYNYVDGPDGLRCLSDVPRCAHCARAHA